MKTKVHKLTVMIIDHDDLGVDDIKEILANQKFPNWCIRPRVMAAETREVDWDDDHPLNKLATSAKAFLKLFKGSAKLPE